MEYFGLLSLLRQISSINKIFYWIIKDEDAPPKGQIFSGDIFPTMFCHPDSSPFQYYFSIGS